MHTGRHFIFPFCSGSDVGALVKLVALVDLISALVHISYKTKWLQCSRIDIAFVAITYPIDPIVRGMGGTGSYHMIHGLTIDLFLLGAKDRRTGIYIQPHYSIVHNVGDPLFGLKRGVADSAKCISGRKMLGGPSQKTREHHQ